MEINENKVCVDSDVIIDFLRGNEPAKSDLIKLFNSGKTICTTSITIYELYMGANLSEDPEREKEKINNMRAYLHEIEFNSFTAEIAGEIDAYLQKIGKKVDAIDVLIYSSASKIYNFFIGIFLNPF